MLIKVTLYGCFRSADKRVSAIAISNDNLHVCFADKFGVVWVLRLEEEGGKFCLVNKKAASLLSHYCSIITSLVSHFSHFILIITNLEAVYDSVDCANIKLIHTGVFTRWTLHC